MKQKQLTSIINEKNTRKFSHWSFQIPAYAASFFSVVFSTSIILELKESLGLFALILTGCFLVFFMLVNEALKITNIRKSFKGVKTALIPFIITFTISITIASISIYFLTNKTEKINDNAIINKSIELNKIEQKYGLKIDSIKSNNVYEKTTEYINLKSNLGYWQNRKAMTLIERNEINTNILKIENDINASKLNHNNSIDNIINNYNVLKQSEISILDNSHNKTTNETKNINFITYLLVVIMLIVELGIVYLNKFIAEDEVKEDEFSQSPLSKKYVLGRYILETIYLHKDENNTTNINVAKYCYELINNISQWDDTTLDKWNELKSIYNLYISLGILDKGVVNEKVLCNNVLIEKQQALTMYDAHHEKFFSINF